MNREMLDDKEIDKYLDSFQAASIQLQKKLLENLAGAQEKHKRYFKGRISKQIPEISVRSKVMVANVALKSQKGKKFVPRYQGPMVVDKIVNNKFYLVDNKGKGLKNPVHQGRLQPFREDQGISLFLPEESETTLIDVNLFQSFVHCL